MKFSVIMANYNNSQYVSEAIESVLEQTYSNWELIIVDDASTDHSLGVINVYIKDERIKLFVNNRNKGVGYTKNKAAEEASGEIVVVLDADDALRSDALEQLFRLFSKYQEVDFVYSQTHYCDNNLKVKGLLRWVGDIEPGSTNLHDFKICGVRAYKKSLYNKTTGYDATFTSAVDRDIIYKLEENGLVKHVKLPLYYYRIHEGGISKSSNLTKKSLGRIYCSLSALNAYKRRRKNKYPNLSRKEASLRVFDGIGPALKIKRLRQSIYLFYNSIIGRHPKIVLYFE